MADVYKTILTKEDWEKALNQSMLPDNAFVSSFSTDVFAGGTGALFDIDEIDRWLQNPDDHRSEIEALSVYLYRTQPDVFQMVDMALSLPSLQYKIVGDATNKKYADYLKEIRKNMNMIHHKISTRELISQTLIAGTTCGIWLDSEEGNPEMFVFNNLDYVYPAYVRNNEWVLWLDLSWLDGMSDLEKEGFFEVFDGIVEPSHYTEYQSNPEVNQFIELPIERTFCIRTHSVYKNQQFGLAWASQSMKDYAHKSKLKDLEQVVTNQGLNSIAVVTIGNEQFNDSKLSPLKKRTAFSGVKNALTTTTSQGKTTVIGVPHWVKVDFPDVKTDGLNPKKFESINADINNSTNGIANLLSGDLNFSSGQLILDVMYKKVGVMLEQIEELVYSKMIDVFIVDESDRYLFRIEYDKQAPLSKKDKVGILKELNTSFGFSLKALLDEVGIDAESYIEASFYEHEELDISNKIKPYQSSYTQSKDNQGGVEAEEGSEAKDKSDSNDSNNVPTPND